MLQWPRGDWREIHQQFLCIELLCSLMTICHQKNCAKVQHAIISATLNKDIIIPNNEKGRSRLLYTFFLHLIIFLHLQQQLND